MNFFRFLRFLLTLSFLLGILISIVKLFRFLRFHSFIRLLGTLSGRTHNACSCSFWVLTSGFLRLVACVVVSLPLCIVVTQIWALSPHPKHRAVTLVFTFVRPTESADQSAPSSRQPVQSSKLPSVSKRPTSETSVLGGPSIPVDLINQVLSVAGSPAAGTGQSLYDLSREFGIDDAYALAVFEKESSFGKYGAGFENHALGNIVCAGYPTCNGRFRAYASWQDGYQDFYRLISQEYVARGLSTVETITPVYAPSSENDTGLYISQVCQSMLAFRSAQSHLI